MVSANGVGAQGGEHAWLDLVLLKKLTELTRGNLIRITPHFQFHVLSADPGDNAFTDCAIAANADYHRTSKFLVLSYFKYIARNQRLWDVKKLR